MGGIKLAQYRVENDMCINWLYQNRNQWQAFVRAVIRCRGMRGIYWSTEQPPGLWSKDFVD
jgi:hypothetical protein